MFAGIGSHVNMRPVPHALSTNTGPNTPPASSPTLVGIIKTKENAALSSTNFASRIMRTEGAGQRLARMKIAVYIDHVRLHLGDLLACSQRQSTLPIEGSTT